MVAPQKITIREADPDEGFDVYRFYETRRDPSVLPRPEADLRRSAEKGLFFVGESAGEIVAVAGVFDLGESPYVEFGGTLVEPVVRGFGLQRLLFQLRIGASVINHTPMTGMLTAVDPINTHSAKNALDAGFTLWNQPIAAVFESCERCPKREIATAANRQCCCDFFILPNDRAEAQVRELLDRTSASPTITLIRRAGHETLSVSVVPRILTPAYRSLLGDFVSGARW